MSKPQSMLYHQNTQYSRVMNLKYGSKYRKIKKQIKQLVFENAALCDEVAQVQSDLVIAREERRYLIRRLMRHEGLEALQDRRQEEQNISSAEIRPPKPTQVLPKKRGPKKRIIQNNSAHVKATKVEKSKQKNARLKQTHDASGKLVYPINLSNALMLHMSGEIITENYNFHNENWIYPVGYVATRIYAHPKDPQRKCVFTCKILNNTGMPQFQVIPDNDFDSVFFGETANHCHQGLLDILRRSLPDMGSQFLMRTQGERFFGLANPTVKSLIQSDPNLNSCQRFKGFLPDDACGNEEEDPALCFEALQSLLSFPDYHTVPEVKDEPPDELLE